MTARVPDPPKAELHVHLDGSLRIETLWELAQTPSVALPFDNIDALRRAFANVQQASLEQYLQRFAWTLSVMQNEKNIHRIALELVEDAARDGLGLIEVRGCPSLSTHEGLSDDAVMQATLAGLNEGSARFGVKVGFIVCAMRQRDPAHSQHMAEIAVRYREQGVVGFDLAGPEAGFLPNLHLGAITHAKSHGLGITIHAGEAAGPESIRAAIDCGASRIGHGCTLIQDAALMDEVHDKQITIECCPSSNVHTGAVADLSVHPLKEYVARGLRVTINTDNRLMSQTTLTQELELCANPMRLNHEQLLRVQRTAFEATFIRV